MTRAIILAAGLGERLVRGKAYPKPLQPVRGVPLIVRVLRNLESAGVTDVGIVVGHLGEVLIEAIDDLPLDLSLHYFWNRQYDKPNGTSLLAAKDFVQGPTFLLMSDHLWSHDLIERVRSYPLQHNEAVLGVDFKIDDCCDLDDATKVRLQGDRIHAIGKQLSGYDALDTGVFRITPAVIEALERVDGPNGCSLSQGMAELAAEGRMRAVDVQEAAWVDVDTPLAQAHAEELLRRYGPSLRPMVPVAPVAPAVALGIPAE
ncbi:MAG: NTP transferase domain-containing protein [Polyangiales bacterium]